MLFFFAHNPSLEPFLCNAYEWGNVKGKTKEHKSEGRSNTHWTDLEIKLLLARSLPTHIFKKKKNPHHAHSSSKSKAQNRFPTKSINMSKCSLCMYACTHVYGEREKKNAQEPSDRVMICRSPFTSVMNAAAFFPSSCTHYALSHLML